MGYHGKTWAGATGRRAAAVPADHYQPPEQAGTQGRFEPHLTNKLPTSKLPSSALARIYDQIFSDELKRSMPDVSASCWDGVITVPLITSDEPWILGDPEAIPG